MSEIGNVFLVQLSRYGSSESRIRHYVLGKCFDHVKDGAGNLQGEFYGLRYWVPGSSPAWPPPGLAAGGRLGQIARP